MRVDFKKTEACPVGKRMVLVVFKAGNSSVGTPVQSHAYRKFYMNYEKTIGYRELGDPVKVDHEQVKSKTR